MKTTITAEEGWQTRAPIATYNKVKRKHVIAGREPRVVVQYDHEMSDGERLKLFITLTYGEGDDQSRYFDANARLPLAVVLRHCLFDLEGFMGEGNLTDSAFREALIYALNTLGSLEFFIQHGEVVAKFTFFNHDIYFVLDRENAKFFFEKA